MSRKSCLPASLLPTRSLRATRSEDLADVSLRHRLDCICKLRVDRWESGLVSQVLARDGRILGGHDPLERLVIPSSSGIDLPADENIP